MLLAAVLGTGLYLSFRGEQSAPFEYVEAERKNITQEVAVTGKVKPAEALDLAFETAGRVKRVPVEVGQRVGAGELLVWLEDGELQARLLQAQANVREQTAKFKELQRGTRPEELRVYEVKVEAAELALQDARENAADTLKDSYTKTDDAVRDKADQAFSRPGNTDSQVRFQTSRSQEEIDLELQRKDIESLLLSWKNSLDALSPADELAEPIAKAKENLGAAKLFLDDLALALSAGTPGLGIIQATFDSWKAEVSTARANVNTAISNVQKAGENLQTEKSDLKLAKEDLTLKQAGATKEGLAAQLAKLEHAEASVRQIQAQLEKTRLHSPIEGLVTKLEVEQGELVSAASLVASVISDFRFEIETFIPEADIAKVSAGNTAKVTLDAYGSSVIFGAEVAALEPGETVLEGVPTYKTTLHFTSKERAVLSGMTANIDILTEQRENVFAIPQRAVIAKDGREVVRLLQDDGAIKEQKVETGIVSAEGEIEIVDGLQQGDKVIVFIKE